MVWQDRDYHRGGPSGGIAAILNWSLYVGRWFGADVRLHLWLIVQFLVILVQGFPAGLSGIGNAILICLCMLFALVVHEFGHRVAAWTVDGRHDELLIWPLGNLNAPKTPPSPWPFFVAHAGGIVANLLLIGLVSLGQLALARHLTWQGLNPLHALATPVGLPTGFTAIAATVLSTLSSQSSLLVLINLLPIYILDAGFLLQAILWPFIHVYKAINVACIVGMVCSALLMLLALAWGSFFLLLFWGFFFFNNYQKRLQLKMNGVSEYEDAIAYSASADYAARTLRDEKKGRGGRWAQKKQASARAAQAAEQAKIDAILAKVHDHGIHSLTWLEKRTLKKATERQRQRDLARRP